MAISRVKMRSHGKMTELRKGVYLIPQRRNQNPATSPGVFLVSGRFRSKSLNSNGLQLVAEVCDIRAGVFWGYIYMSTWFIDIDLLAVAASLAISAQT